MQHKKSLGQHFLKDQNIVDKLVRHIDPSEHDEVIEIGPGNVLTNLVKRTSKDVTAISISKLEDIDKLDSIKL